MCIVRKKHFKNQCSIVILIYIITEYDGALVCLTFALKPRVSSLICLSVKMSGMASVTKVTNSSTLP